MNVYLFRHQAAGFVNEFIFGAPPTDQQTAAVAALCTHRFGATHPKTKKPYWLRVVECPVLDTETVPDVQTPGDKADNVVVLGQASVTGSGTVEAPPELQVITADDIGELKL